MSETPKSIKKMKEIEDDGIDIETVKYDFDEMVGEYHDGMLVRGIYGYGFQRPSTIQAETILPILSGRDIVAQAQSGSGKTGAFGIASIAKVDIDITAPQVIIIGNSKELALQIQDVINNLSKYTDVKTCLCIGQNNRTIDNLNEAKKSHILIGTPGRLTELVTKYEKLTSEIKLLVLDEADCLLNTGTVSDFIENIKTIVLSLPKKSQICCFSATYRNEIIGEDGIINYFMKDPQKILIKNSEVSVKMIKNYYYNIFCDKGKYNPEQLKYNKLVEFYDKLSLCQTVIFVNTIENAQKLTLQLKYDKYSVELIHSKMVDTERREILKYFRQSKFRILIATDLIARGIDVQQVGLVINYDVPSNPEYYIHRVGRSGRFGRIGIAITFVIDNDLDTSRMRKIEDVYEIAFEEMPALKDVNSILVGMATI